MCTLTWQALAAGGYDLLFNRDERNSRSPEKPPQTYVTPQGVSYVAPIDGDHGGTWLLLNAHGLTVAVLNYYPRGIVEVGQDSRGSLPLRCASCARVAEVEGALYEVPLKRYAPFHLVAVDTTGEAVHWRWDGKALHEAPAAEFLTSSSFEPERVQAVRKARFATWPMSAPEARVRFHHQHDAAAGAESVCMRRSDASTRSVCRVKVRPTSRVFEYQAVEWSGCAWPNALTLSV